MREVILNGSLLTIAKGLYIIGGGCTFRTTDSETHFPVNRREFLKGRVVVHPGGYGRSGCLRQSTV